MQKKKIVICGTAHPYRGGLAAFKERLAKEFQDQGHEVEIFTFSLQYPKFLFPGKSQFSDSPAPKGLRITRKINSVNPFNWWKVGRELRKMAPDLVVVKFWTPFMGPSLGTICGIAKKNGKTKTLAIVDNWIPHERKLMDRIFTPYFAKRVQSFLAMSRSVEQDIRHSVSGKPVGYSPHPVFDNFGPAMPKQEAKQLLGLNPDHRYLLFFGFIRDYKGLDLAIEAMADPRVRALNLKLIIAGEYYVPSKPYEDLITRLSLQDSIVPRTDFIPDQEVGKYFCAADLIVQPYKEATQSGVTQVAYNYERPMVVTNVGGLPEIVPDGKVGYVTEVNATAIADAIVRYYAEGKEAEFAANVAAEKPRFLWDHFCAEIFKLTHQIKA